MPIKIVVFSNLPRDLRPAPKHRSQRAHRYPANTLTTSNFVIEVLRPTMVNPYFNSGTVIRCGSACSVRSVSLKPQ